MLLRLKIFVFLLLFNPMVKLIIFITLWIILQIIFNSTTQVSEEIINIAKDSIQPSFKLKEIMFKEIFTYMAKHDAKEYFGTLSTKIGHTNYPLITYFYSEFIINQSHIKEFLNKYENWEEIVKIHGIDKEAIRARLIQDYINYIDLLEIEYNKKLLLIENLAKCEKEIIIYLTNYFSNSITINFTKTEPIMLQHYISSYINQIDLISYIKSVDFKKGNMEVLISCCQKEVINSSTYNFSCFIFQISKYFDIHLQIQLGLVSPENIQFHHFNTIRQIIEIYSLEYIPDVVPITENNPSAIQTLFPLVVEYDFITAAVIQDYQQQETLFYYNQHQEIKRLLFNLIDIRIETEDNITIFFTVCICFQIKIILL